MESKKPQEVIERLKKEYLQLEEKNRFLQALVDEIPDSIYVKDVNLRYVMVNASGYSMHGTNPAMIIGKNDFEIMDSESAKRIDEMDRKALDSDHGFTREESATVLGVTRNYLVTRAPLHGPDGKVVGLFGIARDVTAQRAVLDALSLSEARYAIAYNTSNDLMGIMEVNGERDVRLVSVNRAWDAVTGGAMSTWVGKEIGEFIPPDRIGYVREKYRETIKTSKPLSWEELQNTQAGRRTLETTITPVVGADGRITHALVAIRDVHARKVKEEHQRLIAAVSDLLLSSLDYKQTLRALVSVIVPTAADFCAIDLKSDVTGELEPVTEYSANPAMLLVMDGRSYVISKERDLWDAVRNKESVRLLLDMGVKTVVIAPIRLRGELFGALTLASAEKEYRYTETDLGLAKELAERIGLAVENARLYADAKKAVSLRDDFLSVASHELRTPLTPLKMGLQLMERSMTATGPKALPPERSKDMLKAFVRQVDKLNALVETLLDVSRIRGDKFHIKQERVNLLELVKRTVEEFRSLTVGEGYEISVVGDENEVGNWDSMRIEQVVTNLLTNAIKYGNRKPVEISVRGQGPYSALKVKDQGIGISKQDQKRLFQLFERAVTSEKYSGLGLGLYVCRQIVEAHGGTIHIESEQGRGTEITVMLPKQRKD